MQRLLQEAFHCVAGVSEVLTDNLKYLFLIGKNLDISKTWSLIINKGNVFEKDILAVDALAVCTLQVCSHGP